MQKEPRIEKIIEQIGSALYEVYERGRKDVIAAVMSAANGAAPSLAGFHDMSDIPVPRRPREAVSRAGKGKQGRIRAPRGSVQEVILRAMMQNEDKSASLDDIMAARQGADQLMIAESSVRSALRKGEKAGEYIGADGRWILTNS